MITVERQKNRHKLKESQPLYGGPAPGEMHLRGSVSKGAPQWTLPRGTRPEAENSAFNELQNQRVDLGLPERLEKEEGNPIMKERSHKGRGGTSKQECEFWPDPKLSLWERLWRPVQNQHLKV